MWLLQIKLIHLKHDISNLIKIELHKWCIMYTQNYGFRLNCLLIKQIIYRPKLVTLIVHKLNVCVTSLETISVTSLKVNQATTKYK